jgi:hypothetical protein
MITALSGFAPFVKLYPVPYWEDRGSREARGDHRGFDQIPYLHRFVTQTQDRSYVRYLRISVGHAPRPPLQKRNVI